MANLNTQKGSVVKEELRVGDILKVFWEEESNPSYWLVVATSKDPGKTQILPLIVLGAMGKFSRIESIDDADSFTKVGRLSFRIEGRTPQWVLDTVYED